MAEAKFGLALNEGGVSVQRPYYTPRLERLGDIRDITMGPSVGSTDSGGESALSVFGFNSFGPSAGSNAPSD